MTSTSEVAREVGVRYHLLDQWVRRGYLCPDNNNGGSGTSRRWPEHELLVASVMARLQRVGFTISAAAPIARRAVAGATAKRAERTYYETIGDGVYLTVVVELR